MEAYAHAQTELYCNCRNAGLDSTFLFFQETVSSVTKPPQKQYSENVEWSKLQQKMFQGVMTMSDKHSLSTQSRWNTLYVSDHALVWLHLVEVLMYLITVAVFNRFLCTGGYLLLD